MAELWTYSLDDDNWDYPTVNSKEHAIQGALDLLEDADPEFHQCAYIAACKMIPLPLFNDVDWFIEKLEEQYIEVGGADSETKAFEKISREQQDWLDAELKKLTKQFYEHAGIKSDCYEILDIKTIDRDGNEEGAAHE